MGVLIIMIKHVQFGAFIILLIGSFASVSNRVVLGHLANGCALTFVRAGSGEWGIDISGNAVPHLTQPKPAQIEIYRGDGSVVPRQNSIRVQK